MRKRRTQPEESVSSPKSADPFDPPHIVVSEIPFYHRIAVYGSLSGTRISSIHTINFGDMTRYWEVIGVLRRTFIDQSARPH
jgi:hypothetical protein